MDLVYVLINGSEWEDLIIFLSQEDAIKQSIVYPTCRIEIFSKTDKSGYSPTYNYYKNGVYISKT